MLSHMATEGQVLASTPRQALNTLAFLYRDVMHTSLTCNRPGPQHTPTLTAHQATQAEVQRLLVAMHALMARRLSGGGLRLLESLRRRIQDVDFGQHRIDVRGSQGGQDRTTIRPRNLQEEWPAQIAAVNALPHQDRDAGFGWHVPPDRPCSP